jgi:hypothetical protein
VEQTSSSLPLSSRQTGISASGTVDCNNNNCKGPKARTFAEVAARPPAPLRTGKEPVGGAGVKNNDRIKGRNADDRDARKTNMPGLPPPHGARSVVRREIKLTDLGITEMPRSQPRRAVTGALIFEIAGQDASSKASRLAEKMAGALRDPAKVTVPRKMAQLRVTGLENLITPEEVGCQAAEVSLGVIRAAPRGLGSVWLRCPLTAARKIGSSSSSGGRDAPGGKLYIGWSAARVSPLPARQLQCYKCLETGHVRRDCPSAVDRSDRCYRCGMEGYRARDCLARVPKCPVCADLELPASHRLGSPACTPPARRGRTVQEIRPAPDEGGDATASKETKPLTGPTEARRDKEEAGRDDHEGNGPEEAMETEPSPT